MTHLDKSEHWNRALSVFLPWSLNASIVLFKMKTTAPNNEDIQVLWVRFEWFNSDRMTCMDSWSQAWINKCFNAENMIKIMNQNTAKTHFQNGKWNKTNFVRKNFLTSRFLQLGSLLKPSNLWFKAITSDRIHHYLSMHHISSTTNHV